MGISIIARGNYKHLVTRAVALQKQYAAQAEHLAEMKGELDMINRTIHTYQLEHDLLCLATQIHGYTDLLNVKKEKQYQTRSLAAKVGWLKRRYKEKYQTYQSVKDIPGCYSFRPNPERDLAGQYRPL